MGSNNCFIFNIYRNSQAAPNSGSRSHICFQLSIFINCTPLYRHFQSYYGTFVSLYDFTRHDWNAIWSGCPKLLKSGKVSSDNTYFAMCWGCLFDVSVDLPVLKYSRNKCKFWHFNPHFIIPFKFLNLRLYGLLSFPTW